VSRIPYEWEQDMIAEWNRKGAEARAKETEARAKETEGIDGEGVGGGIDRDEV
jgi:hypothetical protein